MAATKKTTKKTAKTTELEVFEVTKEAMDFYVLGTSPIILNRMNEKARQQLLLPSGRKTAADKQSSLKHNPYEEFQSAPYLDPDPDGPTYLMHLATAFKGAMRGAAVDLPKLTKAQIGRLVTVKGERISVWGHPQMLMSVTRCADMNKTPDIRTRVIVPEWACKITVSWITPLLRAKHIYNLLSFAGLTQGTGDWRSEKGSADYGSFEIVEKDDERWHHIVNNYGRDLQMEAMETIEYYDRETAELYQWFKEEVVRRGFKNVRMDGPVPVVDDLQINPPKPGKSNGQPTA